MKYYINERYVNAWKYYYLIVFINTLWAIISLFYGFLNYFKMKRTMMYFGLCALVFLLPMQFYGAKIYGVYGLMGFQFLYFLACLIVILIILNKKIKSYILDDNVIN